MSQTIASVMVQLLVIFLPMLGIRVGSDQLTVTIQTVTVVVAGLWIWIRRLQQGDVNLFGGRN